MYPRFLISSSVAAEADVLERGTARTKLKQQSRAPNAKYFPRVSVLDFMMIFSPFDRGSSISSELGFPCCGYETNDAALAKRRGRPFLKEVPLLRSRPPRGSA